MRASRLPAHVVPPERPVVLFDGACAFCRSQLEVLRARAGDRLDYVSFREPGVVERYGLDPAACEEAMHVVEPDGTVHRGAAAVARAWSRSRKAPWLAGIYRLPLAAPLLERAYAWVAKRRFRIGGRVCASGACERPGATEPTLARPSAGTKKAPTNGAS